MRHESRGTKQGNTCGTSCSVPIVSEEDYSCNPLVEQLEARIRYLRESRELWEGSCQVLEAVRLRLETENKKLREGVEAVKTLINESYGVAGLHLNGDVAPWDELLEGGKFEEWLLPLGKALEE